MGIFGNNKHSVLPDPKAYMIGSFVPPLDESKKRADDPSVWKTYNSRSVQYIRHFPAGFIFTAHIATSSMEPTLPIGKEVKVQRVSEKQLAIGDIILFTNPHVSIPIAHRIVDVSIVNGKRVFRTKGDQSTRTDCYHVRYKDILGKIIPTDLSLYSG